MVTPAECRSSQQVFLYDLREVKSCKMCSLSLAKTLLFMLNYFAMAAYTFTMGKPYGGYVNGDVKVAWMQARYCPGHREAPEQEFNMVQALSSNEGVILPKDTAMLIGTVKAKQLPGKVALSCNSPCWYITNKLHPKKARHKLAEHV